MTLAEYLGVPVTTISDWRVDGKGRCDVRVRGFRICFKFPN